MKITVDIDCTPDEARRFLGLPDVAPMQDAMMRQIQERMEANMAAMDADTLFKTWMPAGMQGWEALQKMFWSQMGMGGGSGDDDASSGGGAGGSGGKSGGKSGGRGAGGAGG